MDAHAPVHLQRTVPYHLLKKRHRSSVAALQQPQHKRVEAYIALPGRVGAVRHHDVHCLLDIC